MALLGSCWTAVTWLYGFDDNYGSAMRFVELFAGIGGFSLGFERVGMECVGHVEIDPYAQKVLLKHWPDVPLLPDVTKIKGDEFGKVELLCGGFPCQDLSVLGKQAGITGARSGLFDEIIRIARVCRPEFIVLENVANLIARPDWFGYVLGRLAQIGYDAEWEIIRAWNFGLPHSRARVFIVAYPGSQFRSNRCIQSKDSGNINVRWENEKVRCYDRKFFKMESFTLQRLGEEWEKGNSEPGILRISNGLPHQLDRLKCLGNSLIPQIAEYIGKQILNTFQKEKK